MVIGARGEAGCGTEGRIILPDSGRDMREGIGEIVSSMRIEACDVSQMGRSLVSVVRQTCNVTLLFSQSTLIPHDKRRVGNDMPCMYLHSRV
jgi:hypothetical protein